MLNYHCSYNKINIYSVYIFAALWQESYEIINIHNMFGIRENNFQTNCFFRSARANQALQEKTFLVQNKTQPIGSIKNFTCLKNLVFWMLCYYGNVLKWLDFSGIELGNTFRFLAMRSWMELVFSPYENDNNQQTNMF